MKQTYYIFTHFLFCFANQGKDAEIKQIEAENKRMVTEIQQRHEIEMIEMKENMDQAQVQFVSLLIGLQPINYMLEKVTVLFVKWSKCFSHFQMDRLLFMPLG